MWLKIKHTLFANFGLKIIALLLAIILWFVVVNVDDPTRSASFTATVSVINEDVLTEQGKYYTIPDNNASVTFRVTAKRSIIERLSNSDFTAVADMNYLREDNTIPIEITADAYASQVTISAQKHYLTIEVGDNMENRFVVSAETTGTPPEGSAVNEITVTPNVIEIAGQDTAVSQIDHIAVSVDVSDRSNDFTETAVPVLYDAGGNVLDTTGLSLSADTVEVSVDMVSTKSVPITVETSGELPSEYTLDSITTSPSEVTIIGESDLINDITAITIPSTVINLSEITADVSTTVDITTYLPDGVSVLNLPDEVVTVEVKLSGEISKTFTVPTANLSVLNLGDELDAEFDRKNIKVTITGTESKIDALSAEDITGTVDADGLLAGNHTIEVSFNLEDGLTAETTTVRLTITEPETDEEE